MNDCLLRLFLRGDMLSLYQISASLDQWQLEGTQTGPSFPKAMQRMELLETIVDFYIYTSLCYYQKLVCVCAVISFVRHQK